MIIMLQLILLKLYCHLICCSGGSVWYYFIIAEKGRSNLLCAIKLIVESAKVIHPSQPRSYEYAYRHWCR
jgi:hypothetical protein